MYKGLVFLLLSGISLLSAKGLGIHGYDLYQKGRASEEWAAVEAEVEVFELYKYKRSTGNQSNPHFNVVYHFTVDDVAYRGDTLGFGPYSKGQLKRPDRHRNATIHYNPADPTQSVYIKGVSTPNLFFLLFALGLGLLGVVFGLLGLKFLVPAVLSFR